VSTDRWSPVSAYGRCLLVEVRLYTNWMPQPGIWEVNNLFLLFIIHFLKPPLYFLKSSIDMFTTTILILSNVHV